MEDKIAYFFAAIMMEVLKNSGTIETEIDRNIELSQNGRKPYTAHTRYVIIEPSVNCSSER